MSQRNLAIVIHPQPQHRMPIQQRLQHHHHIGQGHPRRRRHHHRLVELIDRAIRYVTLLMEKRTGSAPSYAAVCRALFTVMEKLPPGEPVVLRTVEHLIAEPEAA